MAAPRSRQEAMVAELKKLEYGTVGIRLAALFEHLAKSTNAPVIRLQTSTQDVETLANHFSKEIREAMEDRENSYKNLAKTLEKFAKDIRFFPNYDQTPLSRDISINGILTPLIYLALKFPQASLDGFEPIKIRELANKIQDNLKYQNAPDLDAFFNRFFNAHNRAANYDFTHTRTGDALSSILEFSRIQELLELFTKAYSEHMGDNSKLETFPLFTEEPSIQPRMEQKSEAESKSVVSKEPAETAKEDPAATRKAIEALLKNDRELDKVKPTKDFKFFDQAIAALQKNYCVSYKAFARGMPDHFDAKAKFMGKLKDMPAAVKPSHRNAWVYLAFRYPQLISEGQDSENLKNLSKALIEAEELFGKTEALDEAINKALPKTASTPQQDYDALISAINAKKALRIPKLPLSPPRDHIIRKPGSFPRFPKRGPDANITSQTMCELAQLIHYYRTMSDLALHSNHYFEDGPKFFKIYQELHSDFFTTLKSFVNETERETILAAIPTHIKLEEDFKKDHPKFLEEEFDLLKGKEPFTIYHFGNATEYVPIKEAPNIKMNLEDTPSKKSDPEDLEAHSSPQFKDDANRARITHWVGDDKAVGKTIEWYDPEKNKFISQSHLDRAIEDSNTLKAWACCAVNRFFAAAQPDTKQVTFEDGYSPKQLAALVSYCKFMDYAYEVGVPQKLRVLAIEEKSDSLSANSELVDRLKNYKTINPESLQFKDFAASHADKLKDWPTETWIAEQGNHTVDHWKAWLALDSTREKYSNIPPLRKEHVENLLEQYKNSNISTNILEEKKINKYTRGSFPKGQQYTDLMSELKQVTAQISLQKDKADEAGAPTDTTTEDKSKAGQPAKAETPMPEQPEDTSTNPQAPGRGLTNH